MGCDCCSPPAPTPELVAAPIAASIVERRSCQDFCCDSGGGDGERFETKERGQGEPNQEKSDDCCPAGECSEDEAENDTDASDCCRGKVGPCCDTSCLDRLAMRECEMSAVAAPGGDAQAQSEYLRLQKAI